MAKKVVKNQSEAGKGFTAHLKGWNSIIMFHCFSPAQSVQLCKTNPDVVSFCFFRKEKLKFLLVLMGIEQHLNMTACFWLISMWWTCGAKCSFLIKIFCSFIRNVFTYNNIKMCNSVLIILFFKFKYYLYNL